MIMRQYCIFDICEIKSGKRLPAGTDFVDYETNHPYIRARDIKDGKIKTDNLAYIEDSVQSKIKKYIINSGDIAITIVGASVGDVGFALDEVNGFNLTENAVRLTEFRDMVDSRFLSHLLYQKQYHDYMQLIAGAAAQPKLGIYKIQRIKVQLPDITVQNRIADILTDYDELIENNNKRIKVLEQMAENLYKEWFVRFRFPGHETAIFENGIPKGWEVKKVKDIVKRLPFGTLYKAKDAEKEGKIIIIDQSLDEYVGFHNDDPSHNANIDVPIIIFGDHSCKHQLMITPFSLSENVVPYIAVQNLKTTYLYFLTHGIVETTEYKRHWSEFVAKKVLVAPIGLQENFVAKVCPNLLLIQGMKVQNRNLIRQRDLLLPRLMSGKLEVK